MTDEIQTTEAPETVDAVVEPVGGTGVVEPEVVSDDDAMSAIYDKLVTNNGAERGDDGKFKSPKAEAAAGETVPPDSTDGDSPGGEEGADGEADNGSASTAAPAPTAPSHLPDAVKQAWAKMPDDARAAFEEYDKQRDRKFSEIGNELQRYKPVNDVVNEFKEYFDGTKGKHDPAQAMRALFNIQRNMDTNPVQTLWQIAQTYGIADQLFQGTADSSREISTLTQHIAQLQNQIARLSDGEYIQNQFSLMNEQQSVNKAIEDFAASAPFYTEVESALPAFIDVAKSRLGDTAKPQEVLKAAYDMAVNAIPEVRAKVRDTEKIEASQEPDSKRAEAARKAASINVKSKGSGKQSYSTDEEAMAAVYDKHFAA